MLPIVGSTVIRKGVLTVDNVAILLAIEQIKNLKAKYFRGVDFKDMNLLRQVFAEDVRVDVVGATTDPLTGINAVPEATGQVLNGLDAVINSYAAGTAMMQSVHHGFMPEIDIIDERNAKAIWPMFDTLRFPAGPIAELNGFGHYHETYRCVEGKWKIHTLRLTRLRVDFKLGPKP